MMKKVFTVSKRWLRTQRVIKGGYVLQIQRETADLDKRYFIVSLRVKSSLFVRKIPPAPEDQLETRVRDLGAPGKAHAHRLRLAKAVVHDQQERS